jgi:PPK2 family polyphosphate:nucleotide phosphotransferase
MSSGSDFHCSDFYRSDFRCSDSHGADFHCSDGSRTGSGDVIIMPMAKSTKRAKGTSGTAAGTGPFTRALAADPGSVLAECDTRSTPGFDGDKAAGEKFLDATVPELDDLQERLYAESKTGGKASVLLVLQGMDTSGKGGIMRHVVGSMDPQGVRNTAFKAPTPEERKHPFLWRIRNALPGPGQVGVFDRSHYEDVLIARVHNLVPPAIWGRRYGQINRFEQSVVEAGATIVKVMLHISSDEQKARLTARLENSNKHWKYLPKDVDEREHWPAYQLAYQAAIEKCSTLHAPWFVVPADRKWYARLAVQQLVVEHLRAIDPHWPPATFDVEAEKARLART